MKIKSNVTLYICDHCRKKYQRQDACKKHEQFCSMNPNNQHKCFQHCKHLIKAKEEFDVQYHYDGSEYYSKRTSFKCELLNKWMYSYIAERRDIVPLYNELEDDEREYTRMPLECDKYEYEYNLNF